MRLTPARAVTPLAWSDVLVPLAVTVRLAAAMKLPATWDAPLVRLKLPPETLSEALHWRLCTVTSLPMVMVTFVPTLLMTASSEAAGGTLLDQLLALFQDTPSPPPVQRMVAAGAGLSAKAIRLRTRANLANRRRRSVRGARDDFIGFSFGFSMFNVQARGMAVVTRLTKSKLRDVKVLPAVPIRCQRVFRKSREWANTREETQNRHHCW